MACREKVLNTYDLSSISTKKVIREGFRLTNIKSKKSGDDVEIMASWEVNKILKGDYILLEFDKKKYWVLKKRLLKKLIIKSKK